MKSRFKSHHTLHSLQCCFWVIVLNLLPVFFVITINGLRFIILYFFSQLNKCWHWGVRWEIIVPRRLGADTQTCSWLVWHKTLDGKYKCFVCIGGGRDIDLEDDDVDHNTFPIISMAGEPLKWITVRHNLTLCKTHLTHRIHNSCCCCCCSSQKASHGDISGTKRGIIDPLVTKRPK